MSGLAVLRVRASFTGSRNAHLCPEGSDKTAVLVAADSARWVPLIVTAPKLLDLAKQYASECAECGGTGLVTRFGAYNGGDADDQPCLECDDIRAAIAEAGGAA